MQCDSGSSFACSDPSDLRCHYSETAGIVQVPPSTWQTANSAELQGIFETNSSLDQYFNFTRMGGTETCVQRPISRTRFSIRGLRRSGLCISWERYSINNIIYVDTFYYVLHPTGSLGDVLEVGCGPFTQVSWIDDTIKLGMNSVTLVDPNVLNYAMKVCYRLFNTSILT